MNTHQPRNEPCVCVARTRRGAHQAAGAAPRTARKRHHLDDMQLRWQLACSDQRGLGRDAVRLEARRWCLPEVRNLAISSENLARSCLRRGCDQYAGCTVQCLVFPEGGAADGAVRAPACSARSPRRSRESADWEGWLAGRASKSCLTWAPSTIVNVSCKGKPLVACAGSSADIEVYLTQSVFKVVLQKSNPPQIRQFILYYY